MLIRRSKRNYRLETGEIRKFDMLSCSFGVKDSGELHAAESLGDCSRKVNLFNCIHLQFGNTECVSVFLC